MVLREMYLKHDWAFAGEQSRDYYWQRLSVLSSGVPPFVNARCKITHSQDDMIPTTDLYEPEPVARRKGPDSPVRGRHRKRTGAPGCDEEAWLYWCESDVLPWDPVGCSVLIKRIFQLATQDTVSAHPLLNPSNSSIKALSCASFSSILSLVILPSCNLVPLIMSSFSVFS